MELMSYEYMINNGILLDTGDVCTIHNKPYYRRMKQQGEYTSTAFCLDCQKDELERLKQSSAEQQTVNGMLAKTWSMFESVSNIPNDLKNATMNNFEEHNFEDQKAHAFAQRAVQYYGKGGEGNTLLQGRPGVGKSHLSIAIAKQLNDTFKIYNEPKSVIFMPVARLIQRVQASFNGGGRFTEEFVTKLLTNCDYLILDDLGKESTTENNVKQANDWTYRFLFNILDSRSKTIVNTNFTRKELIKIYDNAFVDRLTKGMRGDKDRVFKFSEGAESKR
jgi:DNA replication protein DnaC